jgi:DNA-binding NarL/FixJ family response regulator
MRGVLAGIAATREVLAISPEVRVVILTTFEQDDYIFGAINAGGQASCSSGPAPRS